MTAHTIDGLMDLIGAIPAQSLTSLTPHMDGIRAYAAALAAPPEGFALSDEQIIEIRRNLPLRVGARYEDQIAFARAVLAASPQPATAPNAAGVEAPRRTTIDELFDEAAAGVTGPPDRLPWDAQPGCYSCGRRVDGPCTNPEGCEHPPAPAGVDTSDAAQVADALERASKVNGSHHQQADWQRHAQRRGAELIRAAYGVAPTHGTKENDRG